MKKQIITSIIILLNLTALFGQETNNNLYKPNYPDGIYETKEDFIKKEPSNNADITPKGLIGLKKPTLKTIEHNCFFYFTDSDEKIYDVFAISYQGHLYFQIGAILANRNKTDRSQSNSFPNSFVRVILGGNNYLYTEADLANAWSKGLAYGGVGGAVGGALASTMAHGKGIVWDFKNKEFNIFKNCEDYNDFIADKNREGLQACNDNQPDLSKVRADMDKIK